MSHIFHDSLIKMLADSLHEAEAWLSGTMCARQKGLKPGTSQKKYKTIRVLALLGLVTLVQIVCHPETLLMNSSHREVVKT